ncbi:MAG TPA: 3-isopropylmalate dehydratase small subunit [Longimicrobiales bacterium]|nr:3-isopropylmalate dehydratase small subunit [Longimicrobiales bacterium]
MEPYTRVTGIVAPLDRADVDTDQIIPALYLKRIERTGFGQFLFARWRYLADGSPDPDFVLNDPRYQGATILVTGPNFGSGSSREHAPWALVDAGFRTIIAPSFADIFRNNCYQNGMLPVQLPDADVRRIIQNATANPGYRITVDLESCTVSDETGFSAKFEIDPFRRECLLKGLDDIGLTLQHEDAIAAYEAQHAAA